MVKVKICGLTRAQDVEAAIELGADALGFVYEKLSPRYVADRKRRQDLTMIAHPFLPTVAVYGKYVERLDTCALVQAVEYRDAGLGTLFLGPGHVPDARPGLFVFRFEPGTTFFDATQAIDEQIFDSHVVANGLVIDTFSKNEYGGTGLTGDWDLAAKLARSTSYPLILAGVLTPENVSVAIQRVRPYAVDVSSGIESSPGIKDHKKVRDFIQAAREAG